MRSKFWKTRTKVSCTRSPVSKSDRAYSGRPPEAHRRKRGGVAGQKLGAGAIVAALSEAKQLGRGEQWLVGPGAISGRTRRHAPFPCARVTQASVPRRHAAVQRG
jgi:hypothetical protein